jgi:hypothetical protein
MNDDIAGLFDLYFLAAIGFSIWIAFKLEKRLKMRLPHVRPYKWGFYTGCMGVAGAPLLLISPIAISTAKTGEDMLGVLALAAWLIIQSVCGFFIIKRRRWAWVIGTILWLCPLVWIINNIYAKHRWKEFAAEAGEFPSLSVPHLGAATPAMPPSLPTSASGNGMFFVAIRGQKQGPYSIGQLRTMWSSGNVPADAQYWQHGMATWYPLIELLERA